MVNKFCLERKKINNKQNSDAREYRMIKKNNIENTECYLYSILLKHHEHSAVSEKRNKSNILLPRHLPHSFRIRRCRLACISKLCLPFNTWTNIRHHCIKWQNRWNDEVASTNEIIKLFLFYFYDEMCFKPRKIFTIKLHISIIIPLDTYRCPPSTFSYAHPITGFPETSVISEEVVPERTLG